MTYSEIVFFLVKGDKTLFDISASDQQAFLDKIKAPTDDVERSFAQYRCQCLFTPVWKKLSRGIVTALATPFFVLWCMFKGMITTKALKVDAVGHFKEYPEILPETLLNDYAINCELWANSHILSIMDMVFISRRLSKYILHPYFCFKCIFNISKYSNFIKKYRPNAIIDHAEFSCTSSILTDYCNNRDVKHINVMHGEKLFYIRDSFFRYDKCYVWDEHYKKLFISLHADPVQFIIEKPRIFHVDIESKRDMEFFADYKYYLQVPNIEEMKSILKSMEFAKKAGLTVKYRLHPNHMNDEAFKIIPKEEIEDPHKVDIETSMASCNYVVGSYTTVLVQAYFSGINVIMDDVTYQSRYKQLKEYKYVLSNTNVKRLSECQ